MHAITIRRGKGHEFEGEWRWVYRRKEREEINVIKV